MTIKTHAHRNAQVMTLQTIHQNEKLKSIMNVKCPQKKPAFIFTGMIPDLKLTNTATKHFGVG